jgi:diaminohydroxyphosphoribosylaminopyrimidine deaminase/5-amino-6-(5-phosphoribosylamino)uracil reductase
MGEEVSNRSRERERSDAAFPSPPEEPEAGAMMSAAGETHMQRALELARLAPFTSPNPRVGCVVVRDSDVISEGYHQGPGTLHAEAAALEGIDASGATMYVTLEPCTVDGRTPPCAPAIVDSGIQRVVVAIEDPDERVRGQGLEVLRSAGIDVEVGLCARDAAQLNGAYIHQRTTGRSQLDGRFAANDGSSRWITSSETRKIVHARRMDAGAVMVGSGTVLADDPSLDVRVPGPSRQPLKVILDARARVPSDARIFSSPGEVVMVTTDGSSHELHTAWKRSGAEVMIAPARSAGGVDVAYVLGELGRRGVLEVYCEAGPTLAAALLTDDLVDRLEIHHGPIVLGAGPTLTDIGVGTIEDAKRFKQVSVQMIADDVLITSERS